MGKSEIVYHHGLDHQPLLNRDMCKCLSRFKILVLESFPQPSPPSTSHPYSVNSCELNDHKGLRLLKGQLPILPHPLPFCNLSWHFSGECKVAKALQFPSSVLSWYYQLSLQVQLEADKATGIRPWTLLLTKPWLSYSALPSEIPFYRSSPTRFYVFER